MQRSLKFSYCSLRAQCMIATSNCVPCDGVSKQSLHSVIVISGTMKVSLSIISRGRMLRVMVLTLYFDLYYSGYHKNLIQQLCAPLCELSVCGRCLRCTQIFTSSSGSFFFSYGGLYLFIRTLAVNRDSVSSTAPLANFQWQNYNSCPSIELCRSGVVQLYSCHWASCGRARFSRVILMFFFVLFKEYSWLLDGSWKINGVDQICPSGSYNIMSFMAAI